MMTFLTPKAIRPRLDGTTSLSRIVFVLVAALWLSLSAGPAGARINLHNIGVNTDIKGTFDPTDPPLPPTGGGGPGSVRDLEKLGYTCAPGHLAAIECRMCGLEPVTETQTCAIFLCRSSIRIWRRVRVCRRTLASSRTCSSRIGGSSPPARSTTARSRRC